MEIKENTIIVDKELNALDVFVADFVKILSSIKYAIVSGYVSILFGRARGSEDIDMVIEPLSKYALEELISALEMAAFECINSTRENAHDTIAGGIALRFARKGTAIPNMEVKFAKSPASLAALKGRVLVKVGASELFISPIELQIVYKKECLGSEKDIEDARHLEIVFRGKLSLEKLNNYQFLIRNHGC